MDCGAGRDRAKWRREPQIHPEASPKIDVAWGLFVGCKRANSIHLDSLSLMVAAYYCRVELKAAGASLGSDKAPTSTQMITISRCAFGAVVLVQIEKVLRVYFIPYFIRILEYRICLYTFLASKPPAIHRRYIMVMKASSFYEANVFHSGVQPNVVILHTYDARLDFVEECARRLFVTP